MISTAASFARSDNDEALAIIEARIDEQRHAEPLTPLLRRRGLGGYRGYADMLAQLLRLSQRGARLLLVGRSVRGEPLIAVQLGAATSKPRMRTSAIVAGLHPNEWIGIETCMAMLERLCSANLTDRSIIAFPIANPDGVLRVEHNLRAGKRRFVRHNARGVDLNRNFDSHWGHNNLLARCVPWVFKSGSHPASEPEVLSIARALGRRRVDRALSLHSFGGAVLYPSAHSLWPIPDADEHRRWARRIADRASSKTYRALQTSWFSFGLTTGGLEIDWFHQRHGALSLLVECSRGGFRFTRERMLEPFAWFNPSEPAPVAEQIADASLPFVLGDAA